MSHGRYCECYHCEILTRIAEKLDELEEKITRLTKVKPFGMQDVYNHSQQLKIILDREDGA